MKKKIITVLFACVCIFALSSCGQNIAEEAAEKGRTYFDSGDYETAAKAFLLAVENGNTDEEINRLYDITLKYYQADKAYNEREFEKAAEILEGIDESYKSYGIKEKITTLESNIKKSIEAEELLNSISESLEAGDYVTAAAAAEKTDITLLSPEQTDRLNEYKISISQKQEEILQAEEQAQKEKQTKAQNTEAKKTEKTTAKTSKAANSKKQSTASANTAANSMAAKNINVNVSKDEYIYPSDTTLLTAELLTGLTKDEAALIRNEIYARRGHTFTKNKYISYFSEKSWYQPSSTVSWAELNEVEKENIKLLKEYESKL